MNSNPNDTTNPIKKYLFEARNIADAAEREEYLERVCAGDQALLDEIKSLLSFAEEWEGYVEEEDSGPVGKVVGKYEIRREIGKGGMGTVYLGVRTQDFTHQAAVKIVKPGVMTPEGIRQFGKELTILASLRHPNIAGLHDGGLTEDRQPYFVMEYVEGQHIDAFCESNRLSVRERLELFRKVCGVVAYLHRQGVMHRDIKPSNILVTHDGEPKLIDFGIAKVINPALAMGTADPTALLQRAFSPDYASPEQVRADQPTQSATDIYSLGAVLYEVLTGHRPHRFGRRDFDEVQRVICEVEPVPPSKVVLTTEEVPAGDGGTRKITPEQVSSLRDCQKPRQLSRQLSGDLDCIVAKAMRKEARKRYATPEELGADIANHLNDRPVAARRGSWWYRAEKFAAKLARELPPHSMRLRPKLAAYAAVVAACLLFWQFRSIENLYYLAVSTSTQRGESAPRLPLSNKQEAELHRSLDQLGSYLGAELKERKRSPNAWTAAQMAVGLAGRESVDEGDAFNFLWNTHRDAACDCWVEHEGKPRHLAVSSWVLLAMGRLNRPATARQVEHILSGQTPGGWWPIFPVPPTADNASTYATATAVLSLHDHLRRGFIRREDEGRVRNAVGRGVLWLQANRIEGKARWWDYPFNSEKTESVGLSGFVLHTLHAASGDREQLAEIDGLWLQSLPVLEMDAKSRQVSKTGLTADTPGTIDTTSQYPLQWSLIATADAYPAGTLGQKGAAVEWMRGYMDHVQELTQGVLGNTDWIAAELFISLRYLEGDDVI